jgi:hypothetical protein
MEQHGDLAECCPLDTGNIISRLVESGMEVRDVQVNQKPAHRMHKTAGTCIAA